MWNFVNNISQANLDVWYRWLTISTIVIPIVGALIGGICGWGAFVVSNRIRDLQTASLEQAEQTANTASHRLQYLDVAKLNAVGLTGSVGVGLEEHSPLNSLLSPYVHFDPGNLKWDCSDAALAAYSSAIKSESKFPFSYYYRASCEKGRNIDGWQKDVETARRIFLITTQMPGHHPHHDEVLHLIEVGNVGRPVTPSH
jgi:hypothetical protein